MPSRTTPAITSEHRPAQRDDLRQQELEAEQCHADPEHPTRGDAQAGPAAAPTAPEAAAAMPSTIATSVGLSDRHERVHAERRDAAEGGERESGQAGGDHGSTIAVTPPGR